MTDLERQNTAINTLREQIAPEASDDELAYFGEVCQRLGLSPFKGEIVLIGRNQKVKVNGQDTWRKIHRHQVTVDGRLSLAWRTGNLVGIEGPVWCGPRDNGQLVWRDVWDEDDQYPYCARVLVHVRGWNHPVNGTTKWSEFAQYTDKDRQHLAPLWLSMPSHMLGKTALSLALRRGFPDVIPADVADGWGDSEFEPVASDQRPNGIKPGGSNNIWTSQKPLVQHTTTYPELNDRIAVMKTEYPEYLAAVRDWWKRNNYPPVGTNEFTQAHADQLLAKLQLPESYQETVNTEPESTGETGDHAYRYDPDDGAPF